MVLGVFLLHTPASVMAGATGGSSPVASTAESGSGPALAEVLALRQLGMVRMVHLCPWAEGGHCLSRRVR
jgi:hypothetical protein